MTATTDPGRVAPVPRLALSMREAGDAIGLSARTVEQLVAARALPVVRVGRRVLIPVPALERWIAQQAEAQEGGEA